VEKLINKMMQGAVLLVGEFRGAKTEVIRYVDKKTGQANSFTATNFSAQRLGKQSLYMWTFTFAEVLPIKDTRKRWNHLLTLLRRRWPDLCGLRVFELHDRHGLHVHLVTNRSVDVNEARKLSKKAGWGRIHVMRMAVEKAAYLAKYLTKDREPCFKGWRLWAGFGEWDWSRVKDILFETPRGAIYQACKTWLGWKGNHDFRSRMETVEFLYRQTLEMGGTSGTGPNGRLYGGCPRDALLRRR
jgi:hypothetical protein